jgi:hypothetical protein
LVDVLTFVDEPLVFANGRLEGLAIIRRRHTCFYT